MSGNIKCLIWDLDNTLWDGILSEGRGVELRSRAQTIIKTLDERGIVQSVASRNHHQDAERRLRELGLWEYFLYPQINWGSKVDSVRQVAERLNIALAAIAIVDDDPFERASIEHGLPEVTCLDGNRIEDLLSMPRLNPLVTADSRQRRLMYQQDIVRQENEQAFVGSEADFLATLGMRFAVFPAQEDDLLRAEELTVRTHQLNSTGVSYCREELDAFRASPNHLLLMASLEDRFGEFGRIGLTLIEQKERLWCIRLLLMSCRVMSRGVGSVLLNYIISRAARAGVTLQAEFVPNDRNRVMAVTYGFAGFRQVAQTGASQILELSQPVAPPLPSYIRLDAPL